MLDVSIRLEILNLLDRLKRDRNLAMLYVTHDLATARHFSAEIMVMYRGEIVEHGPSDEVILQPGPSLHPDPGRRRTRPRGAPRGPGGRARAAPGRPGRPGARAERREAALDQGCRFRARCPHAMEVCATRPPDVAARPATGPAAGSTPRVAVRGRAPRPVRPPGSAPADPGHCGLPSALA